MKTFFGVTFLVLVVASGVAWWMPGDPSVPGKTTLTWVSDDNPARKQQIALFNEEHDDLWLTLDPTNQGMEKVIVQAIADVGPDLFDCYDPFQLSAYARSGIAWDITDELARRGIDAPAMIWKAVHPYIVYDGRVYGFPMNAGVDGVWLNRDMFRRRGLPVPTGLTQGPGIDGDRTWHWERDLVPLAKELTIRDERGRAVQFGFLFHWDQWRHFIRQWGGSVYTQDGTRCVVDSPAVIAATQFMHDLVYKHRVSPDPAEETQAAQGGWGAGTITWFLGGKVAMALGGRWWLCTMRGKLAFDVGAVYSPRATVRRYRSYGRSTLINRDSPRREEALEFLLFLTRQPYNDLVNHQADALAPVKKYCYAERYLHDPQFPKEDFNAMWRDAMACGVPDDMSPFVNGNVAWRILKKQLDLVKADAKGADAAMRDAARLIHVEMAKMLRRSPSLREKYRTLTGRDRP